MNQNMRSKIVTIGILLVLGIGISFMYVTFADSVFTDETKPIKEIWMTDRQRAIVPNASDNLSGSMKVQIVKEGATINLFREGMKVGFLNLTETKIVPVTVNLTDRERMLSKEIALNDSEVKKLIDGKDYAMNISPMISTDMKGEMKLIGASIALEIFEGSENTLYFVHVDLKDKKVMRISPPSKVSKTYGIKI